MNETTVNLPSSMNFSYVKGKKKFLAIAVNGCDVKHGFPLFPFYFPRELIRYSRACRWLEILCIFAAFFRQNIEIDAALACVNIDQFTSSLSFSSSLSLPASSFPSCCFQFEFHLMKINFFHLLFLHQRAFFMRVKAHRYKVNKGRKNRRDFFFKSSRCFSFVFCS